METLKQRLKIAAILKGDKIIDLAKRWGCADCTIHRVANGTATSKKVLEEIKEYIGEEPKKYPNNFY